MKMKQVCNRTGLTERTVRFYVEEELLQPQMTIVNGREYREYSEADIAELTTIAELRKLFFSIEEIKIMKLFPERIGDVVQAYRERMASDVSTKAAIVHRLENVDVTRLPDTAALARSLSDLTANLSLPRRDIEPDFGRLDGTSKEEREEEYQRYLERQRKQFLFGKLAVITIAGLNVIFALLSAVLDFRLLPLILNLAISIALFAGVVWVRYLFVVGLGLNVLRGMFILFNFGSGLPGWLIGLVIFQTGFAVAACWALLRSPAVSEFLYAQKHG